MKVITTLIEGVFIIEPDIIKLDRDNLIVEFNKKEFDEKIGNIEFVQENESLSVKGVIRGLHFQKPPFAQAKLVRCVKGKIIDVVVDLRRGSKSYGKYLKIELTEENHRQCFLPRGMAHGFSVLSPTAIFEYKCDNYYNPKYEGGISILDPYLAIDWGIDMENSIISDKDKGYPLLHEFISPFV